VAASAPPHFRERHPSNSLPLGGETVAQPTDQTVRANDRMTFQVKVAGSGQPLVFLHGAGGLTWDPFLDALSERFRVYAPFMPGTGESTEIQAVRDIWELVLDYYDLFDALGLDRPDVVGASLGGMIAAEIAANDQSRVRRLALIAPAGLWLEEAQIPDIFALLPHEVVQLVVADPDGPLAQAMLQGPETIEGKMEAYIARVQVMQAAAKLLWPIPDKGLSRRAHRIKAPTLLLWGKQDRLIPPVYAQAFARLIPDTRTTLIDNAGHMLPLEQTARAVDAVASFLAQPSPVAVA
jgi:pimeloyl-ACP methyl ester carboxylesterase